MQSTKPGNTIHTFPHSRIATFDMGFLSNQVNSMKAIFEVDVTKARESIRILRRVNKQPLSFFSYLLKCVATAASENKEVHAIRLGKNKLVVFDEVDISVVIEKEVEGKKVPLPLVIRDVGGKSMFDIHNEIENARNQIINDKSDYVLGQNKFSRWMGLYIALPRFIRLFILKKMLKNPYLIKKMSGTVVVTSVGMMGNIKGWAVPSSFLPLAFVLGSIVKKPAVVDNQVCAREFLLLSVAMDHDVVDGAPATRFISRLATMIEEGEGL